MGGIDEGEFVATNDEGVIGGAVLQSKFNIKSITFPVHRSNRRRIGCNVLSLDC